MEWQDQEGRKEIEREVYAPAQGWQAAQADFMGNLMRAGQEEG